MIGNRKENSEQAPWDRPKTDVVVRVKTIYIIGMLLGLGVLGIVFAFFLLPKNNVSSDSYSGCNALNQEKCISRSDCQAIFNVNAEFTSCIALNITDIEKKGMEKTLCNNTRGEWKAMKFGYFCDCSPQKKIYTNGIGCY